MNNTPNPILDNEIYNNHLNAFIAQGVDVNKVDNSKPMLLRTGFMIDHDEDGIDNEFQISRGRVHLRKGFIYLNKVTGEHCELVEYINETSQVVVRNIDDDKTSLINITQLSNITDEKNKHVNIDVSLIGDEAWAEAQHKFEVIKPLLGTEVYGNHQQMMKKTVRGMQCSNYHHVSLVKKL